jgi:hypothetical protein
MVSGAGIDGYFHRTKLEQLIDPHIAFGIPANIPSEMANFSWTGTLRPHYPLSDKREVPSKIQRPDYADQRGSSLFPPILDITARTQLPPTLSSCIQRWENLGVNGWRGAPSRF